MIGDGPQRALTPGAAYIVIISREVKKKQCERTRCTSKLVAIVPYKTKKQCLYSYFIFI